MFLKNRTEPEELLILKHLNKRMELTPNDRKRLTNLQRGFEGEVQFDNLAKNIIEERYILNDLRLEVNNSELQIDSFIISQGITYLLDVKNFYGDFYIEGDQLFSIKTGEEYKNPLDQLKRSALLLRQLFNYYNFNFLIEPYVIFVNPEFTLYQAPMDHPFILPTQNNRFIRELNETPSRLNEGHKKLAQTLLSLHQPKNRFQKLPEYRYEQLKKGMLCKKCGCFFSKIDHRNLVCENCGELEKIESAILRNTEEFKLLFPERKVTTSGIEEWCRIDLSNRTFRRVLKKHYPWIGNTKDTYFKPGYN
ncbi:nuclease-related domain-containing protein [Neobacillus sp. YIM B06451]|uniref:nuclease-related domain-containing protein n=1 Tax=Neobacillus sp. YIM B06451 TaxID=3070994 RepID=UPI0029308203|nr:nuclease-related domain-containing protein [Neobacillus sp. YIM B06451]